MPDQLAALRIVEPVLTELARGYSNPAYVAEQILPSVPVDKEGGKVPEWGKTAFQLKNTERAIRAPSNVMLPGQRANIDFVLTEHDLSSPVDYREEEESMFDESVAATFESTEGVKLRLEKAAADLLTNPSNYPSGSKTTLTSTAKFSDSDGIDPVITFNAGKEAMRLKIGRRPNALLLGASTFNALMLHEKLLDRIKWSMKGIMNLDLLKGILEIDNIMVGEAIYADDDGTHHDIWGDIALLAWIPPAVAGKPRSVREPAFGYTLRKKGKPLVDSWMSPCGKIRYYRYTDIMTPKIVGSDAGYLMDDCV